jgi:CheY-like chemotaxis protein
MKRQRPDVKVILCSGYSEQESLRRFAGEGLAGFLQKPYQLEELKDRLASVLKPAP